MVCTTVFYAVFVKYGRVEGRGHYLNPTPYVYDRLRLIYDEYVCFILRNHLLYTVHIYRERRVRHLDLAAGISEIEKKQRCNFFTI